MERSTDSRRARNSDSVMIGGRRRPVSRPSRRRCFLASSRVEPLTDRTSSLPFGSRTCTTVSGGSSGVSESGPAAAVGRTTAALAAAPARTAARALGVVLGRTAGASVPVAVRGSGRRGRVGAGGRVRPVLGRAVPGRAGPAAARTGRRSPGPLRLRLAFAVGRVRRRVLGFLASLGFRLAVAGFRGGVLVAGPAPAAARPPPAAAPRTRAVVIVAGATGPVGAPAGPGGRRGTGLPGPVARARAERARAAPSAAGTPPAAAGTPPRARPGSARRHHARPWVVIEFSVVQLALEHSGNLQSGSRARGTAAFR